MLTCDFELQTSVDTVTSAIRELLLKLPARDVSDATAKLYQRTLLRMKSRDGDRSAAGGRCQGHLRRKACLSALGRAVVPGPSDHQTRNIMERRRCESMPSMGQDCGECGGSIWPRNQSRPPLWDGKPDFLKPSRWQTENKNKITRGSKSKKHTLGSLPAGWIERFWRFVPVSHKYRDAIAVISVSPARPGEVVPGDRPSGFSAGVAVALDKNGFLVLAG